MTADLRSRLKALVARWINDAYWNWDDDSPQAIVRRELSGQLAALLAESEPKPCSAWRRCEQEGEDGHFACEILCADCGRRPEDHPKPMACGQPREAHE